MEKEYTAKQVVEIIKHFHGRVRIEGSYTLDHFLKAQGLIKEEFEVGEWCKIDGNILLCITFISSSGLITGYGIDENNNWMEKGSRFWSLNGCYTIPSPKEVEEALKKEGDKYIGKTSRIQCGVERRIKRIFVADNSRYGMIVYGVCYNNFEHQLFINGKWAEIVEEKKIIKVYGLDSNYEEVTMEFEVDMIKVSRIWEEKKEEKADSIRE